MARAPFPSYEDFAARAREVTRAIPAEFLEGVEEVATHREAKGHPLLAEVLTLGECEPSRLAAMTASGIVRSIVHLYYGSFRSMAREDPRFDWQAELEETIRHEVQHHIEDRAGVRTLVDEDDLFDAHQRFRAGLETPPGWWRRGERLEPDVYAVGSDLFVELRLRAKEWDLRRGTTVSLTVLGEPFEAELPEDAKPGEILTFEGEGLLEDDDADEEAAGPGEGEEEGGATGDLHLVVLLA